ncbi:hypothetical protein L4D20_13740 [Vibrio kyushuensis]|uniref:hypothetical protein n=1 Tax=Vibrio kyushuensis TaxID=2910249 RepID=UPI003D0C6E99
MATFQFYKKDKILLHLDTNAPSFSTENEQLNEQGFELIGDIVEAENSQIAHEEFKAIHGDVNITSKSQMLVGVLTAGTGALSS